jgi:hypothetical protein
MMDISRPENRRRPLRLKPSDPAYRKLNELAGLLAVARNAHMVNIAVHDLGEPERQVVIGELEEVMTQWIEAGAFASFIYQLLPEQGVEAA